MDFRDCLSPDMMLMLHSHRKEDALLEMIGLLQASGRMKKKHIRRLKEGIFGREKLMSTGIGLGLAVPHVRLEGLGRVIVSVGLNPEGVPDYESMDNRPVKLIFMIIADKKQHKEYLTLLSQLVAFLKNDRTRRKLMSQVSSRAGLYNTLMKAR